MARATLGILLSDLRGKLGNAYFRGSCSGLSLSGHSHPTFSKSASQWTKSTFYSQINAAWQALSALERADWDLYAVFCNQNQKHNKNRSIKGSSFFSAINYRRLCYSLAMLSTAPTVATVPAACTFTLLWIGPQPYIVASRLIDDTSEYIFVSMTPPIIGSKKDYINSCRVIPLVTTVNINFTFQTEYESVFGITPIPTMTLGMRICLISLSSGLSTPINYSQTTI
jgi:hypothetical protein